MAPVVAALRARAEVRTRVAFTGQHTGLVDDVVEALGLRPDHDLALMREGQDLYHVARECLDGMRRVIEAERPDLVLVQGDTASVFFTSLVGYFEGTRIGHVEAGLRSGRRRAPFPEEMFRRLADVLAELHFAPTAGARRHLLEEGISPSSIHLTGNTVVDALLTASARSGRSDGPGGPDVADAGDEPDDRNARRAPDDTDEPAPGATIAEILGSPERLLLLTAHRRESFGEPLREVFGAVREVVDAVEDVRVVYPVHPNPHVRGPAEELLSNHPRIHLVEPLGYRDLVRVLRAATLVLTDSGGIQEEAPTFGTPVLVLRDVTERPEGVEAGVALLVGTRPDRIVAEARRLLGDETARRAMAGAPNPYGDGRAGERIADIVVHELTGRPRRTRDWVPPPSPATAGTGTAPGVAARAPGGAGKGGGG